MLSSHSPAPYQTPEGGYHPGGFVGAFPQGGAPVSNEHMRTGMGTSLSPPPVYNPQAGPGYGYQA